MTAQELRDVISGEVVDEVSELKKYSHDASIFEIRPQVVVRPRDTDDLKKLVQFVAAKKKSDSSLSLTARSAGTDMSGGALNDSIIVDLKKYFNHILEIGDSSATTEPGVYYRDFERATLKNNLLLPSYPASREICTVGGMVANNSGGEKSLRYGKTEDYIQELNVVLSDGEEYLLRDLSPAELETKKSRPTFEGKIYRELHNLLEQNYDLIQAAKPKVSKNSAGYCLWDVWDRQTFNLQKLFVGSQGTLGFVTKIKFKLIHPKRRSELLIIFLNDLQLLGDLANAVRCYEPESFESYDDHTFKMAMRFLPDLMRQMKGNAVLLAFKFIPELWLTLRGGVPKLILIAEFTGNDEQEVVERLRRAQAEVQIKFKVKTHITRSPSEAQKYWVMRRESFNLLRKHVSGKQTAPFIDDIIVQPAQLPEFLPRLNNILNQYPHLIYTIAGHVGDGNFHIIPLMNLRDEADRRIIPELSEKVYDLVLEFGGSITAEHNDGLIRTPYLGKMYSPKIIDLFKQVKDIFDSQNIFNPGKKIGGDIQYALQHIKKE